VPRVELSLSQLPVVDGLQTRRATWSDIVRDTVPPGTLEGPQPIAAIVAVKPVLGVAITQNCDAARARDIGLCQVAKFLTVAGQKEVPQNAKKWQSLIIRMVWTNPILFYLPAAPEFGLSDCMAADL
jgi:hypothetical protein